MKILGYILLIITLTSFRVSKTNEDPTVVKDCVIKPGYGLNDIVLEKSTLTEAISQFGKNRIKKRMVRGCGYSGDGKCGKEQYVNYKEEGIYFSTGPRRKQWTETELVKSITLRDSCNCKTDKGIGIGSTRAEIIRTYGMPRTELHSLGDRMSYNGIIYLFRKPMKDTSKVRKIWVREFSKTR